MRNKSNDIRLVGNAELILSLLHSKGVLYGLKMVELLDRETEGKITIPVNLLYPALNNLSRKAYVESFWEEGNFRAGARRKFYKITEKGINLLNESEELRKKLRIVTDKDL